MGNRMKKTSKAHPKRDTNRLARQVRALLTSLALPSIMTACAPVPHTEVETSDAGSSKTILYVRPHGKPVAESGMADPDSQDTSNEASSASPANKYVPIPSDIPIFEKILSKYRIFANDKTPETFGPPAPGSKAGRAPQVTAFMPPMPFKSGKDGIWDRMRQRLMLSGYEHETVLAQVDKIRRSPGALNYLSKRAEPFLFYIVDEIDRRNLPMDLALVPMVESAFEPAAISAKEAAGIWQFIPSTAADYGLKLVDGYDGRYDVYASTKAALKYLAHLQGLFGGDWLLALAAYNAGEGTVQRAIAANQKAKLGTSFWDLPLPAETKAYVPKILALSRVIADPGNHGVNLRKISPLPNLARLEVNGQPAPLHLAQVVAGAGMSWEEFSSFNPAFKPDVTPATPYNLLLPLEKAQNVASSLQGAKLIAARKYVVKKGETLTVIAKQEGVPTLKLAEWNGLKADSRVKPGQELIIYPV